MSGYEQRIVAFIDLLGFKNKVKESDKVLLGNINNLLKYLFDWGTGQPNTWDSSFIQNDPDVQANKAHYTINRVFCTCFSDSLAVSIPFDASLIEQQFSTFISNLAHICVKFIQAGIPLRGGITMGNLVHTDKVLYGTAMNEAVELEKCADYPRIILSKGLIDKLRFSPNQVYPYRHFLSRFNDGCVGLHPLKFFEYQQNTISVNFTLQDEIARGKNCLIENLDEHLCDTKVFAKYKWMVEEYNKLNIQNKIKTDLTDGGQKPYNIFYREVNP